MTMPSYSDVFSISHDRGYPEVITAGDVVCTGDNLHPRFQVIAVNGDKAWVRNLQSGAEALALLDRCRRVGPSDPGLAFAAE